ARGPASPTCRAGSAGVIESSRPNRSTAPTRRAVHSLRTVLASGRSAGFESRHARDGSVVLTAVGVALLEKGAARRAGGGRGRILGFERGRVVLEAPADRKARAVALRVADALRGEFDRDVVRVRMREGKRHERDVELDDRLHHVRLDEGDGDEAAVGAPVTL